MWSRSTKQRRAAMRRKLRDSPLARWIADAGPGEFFTFAPRLRTTEEQNALYEQRPFVPSPRTSPHAAPFRTLVYAETPKETK